jgi:hypothetical protein
MSKTTISLLVLSLSCLASGLVFVTGLINVGDAVGLYAALPAGAIFFGLFLISLSLQVESALFDEEQRTAIASAKATVTKPCCKVKTTEKEAIALAHGA